MKTISVTFCSILHAELAKTVLYQAAKAKSNPFRSEVRDCADAIANAIFDDNSAQDHDANLISRLQTDLEISLKDVERLSRMVEHLKAMTHGQNADLVARVLKGDFSGLPAAVVSNIADDMRAGQKIAAIKELRAAPPFAIPGDMGTTLGLKEAKDAVEAFWARAKPAATDLRSDDDF